MPLRIVRPSMQVCPGKRTQYPPVQRGPINWIRRALPEDYKAIDFDGFSVSRTRIVTRLLLLREFVVDNNPVQNDVNIDEEDIEYLLNDIRSPNGLWPARVDFARQLGVDIDVVLCPRDYPVDTHHGDTIYYIAGAIDEQNSEVINMDLDDLQQRIRALRGRSFDRPKNLNAAKTKLECWLANNTGDPWPGDLDGVLMLNGEPLCILEFKTHNLNTPIQDERIGKYGKEDWRRFYVLYSLQQSLGNIPILFVVWGENHGEIKIDKIVENDRLDSSSIINKNEQELVQAILSLI